MILIDITSEDGHAPDAKGKGKERLVHGSHDDRSVDLGEIRYQIELQAFLCTGQGHAVYRQHHQEEQQSDHHDLRHALQTLLQTET